MSDIPEKYFSATIEGTTWAAMQTACSEVLDTITRFRSELAVTDVHSEQQAQHLARWQIARRREADSTSVLLAGSGGVFRG